MITTTVVGKIKAPDGTVVENAEIIARLNGFDYDPDFGYITSRRITTTTDVNGEFSFELWPNTRGTEGSIYRIAINSPINGVSTTFTATIPEQAEVELNDAADFDPVPPLSDAEQLVNEAKALRDEASDWASEDEDVVVKDGLFSALHYSAKSEDSAIAAATSESNAATSESNAASSASAASTSASNAATSESNAASSASAAATSETNAQTAETGAISAKDDAVAAKNATENIFDTFDDRFLGAFSSAPTTDNDGNPIVAGAVYYDTTQQEVYFYNGATWDAPAAQAETSATNALASENAAETSANEAATSASNASDSETAAANSASAAATSESNADISETNAANSASAAATSESNAATSESNAAASASAASTSESNAASSASAAASSESNAATSETNAANSASAAAISETNAANSASAAATSESNAATSAQNAADSFDSFDDRYLGAKSSEPSTDNDGDPLQTGALYFDTTLDELRVYDGTQWLSTGYNSANVTITGGSITGTDVDVSGATFTVANDQISGDAINGGTATPTTVNTTNLNVDSGTLFVDSANNRVGVGTSSPDAKLHIATSENNPLLAKFTDLNAGSTSFQVKGDTGNNAVFLKTGGGNNYNQIRLHEDGFMQFYANNAEAMRISSAGNLLVGTTTGGIASTGLQQAFEYVSGGALNVSRSGSAPINANLLDNTGFAVTVRSNGNIMGGLGTRLGSAMSLILDNRGTGAGLSGANQVQIRPCDGTGNLIDNTIDLGASGDRFKDLYLSGGVYLGGTGSANYLDDYEEGTWTPVLTDGTATKTLRTGLYTKIGDTVHISFDSNGDSGWDLTNQGFGSSHVYITGVPFPSIKVYSYPAPIAFRINSEQDQLLALFNRSDATRIDIINFNENNSDDSSANVSGSSLSTSASQYYSLSLTYKTNS